MNRIASRNDCMEWQQSSIYTVLNQIPLISEPFRFALVHWHTTKNSCGISGTKIVRAHTTNSFNIQKNTWDFHRNWPLNTNWRMWNPRYTQKKCIATLFHRITISYNVMRAFFTPAFVPYNSTFVHKVIHNFQNIFSNIKLLKNWINVFFARMPWPANETIPKCTGFVFFLLYFDIVARKILQIVIVFVTFYRIKRMLVYVNFYTMNILNR